MNNAQPGIGSSRQEWIDALCESFEQQWKAGDPPAIEEFLRGGMPDQYRADVLCELIALDVELRQQAGEDPRLSAYLQKFSSHEEVVREGFAIGQAQRSSSHTQPSRSRDIPDCIGSYRVESWLGEGAFGEVFKAHDPQENRIVALKVLLPHRASNADDLQRFLFEAERTLEFQHPGIVTVYGVKHDFRRPYIVQEFIDGSDLRHFARQTQLSHDQIVGVLIGMADALAYIHAKNLYHRDLKPANVLIDREGRPHLADFGLAMEVGKRWEHRGELAGSLAYMSREQIRGEPHLVTGSSDIWSLGVIMYELLTGELPFPGEPTRDPIRKAESIRAEIEGRGARGLREISPGTPAELQRICLKCLSKEAVGRYPSATDLLDDLRQWQSAPLTIQTHGPKDAVAAVRFQGLRSFTEEHADFFLELLPGSRDRDGLPDSISFWKHRIERTDPDETSRLGVLYGISGSGKSSLLRAGLIPQLQRHARHVTCVHVTASSDDTEVDLLKRLRKTFPGLPSEAAQGLSLPEAMHLLRETDLLRPNQKLLIILDQFEQWLHAHGSEPDPQLLAALRQCDGGRVQTLIAVRDGFMISLTRFLRAMGLRFSENENMAVADLFTKPHALHVLTLFGRAMQKLDEPLTEQQQQFLDLAVDGLADDNERIVCVRLALFAAMMEPWPWTPVSIKDLGGFDQIGVRFLRQKLEGGTDLEKRHEEVSQRVLAELLPSLGLDIKGNRRSRQALLDASEFPGSPAEFSEVLDFLEQNRLITPVERELGGEGEQAQTRRDGGDYQLTHDFLVPAVREYLAIKKTETAKGRAELRLAERAGLWKARPETRHLPSLSEYFSIVRHTSRKQRTTTEQEMMRKATRVHALRALLILFSVATFSWAVLEARGRFAVNELVSATDAEVFAAADRIGPSFWARAKLRAIVEDDADTPEEIREKLHARIALVRSDDSQVEPLREELLKATTPYVGVIREALLPHKDQLSAELAKDNGWGYKRILGELRKLGIRKISLSTISRILKEFGFDPGPKRGEGTWHDFVQRHISTLWACDFFTAKVWTLGGLVEYYVLFFMHVGTRRVHVAGITPNPDGAWMAQQARNLCMFFEEQGEQQPTHIIRDRDGKFTEQFCCILESEGMEFRKIPPRSPNMNPFAESWVQKIRRECLDHFLVLGERHLQYLLHEYLVHYHEERPHQGLGNRPLNFSTPPPQVDLLGPDDIVCRERLGGLLKHYERKAA